MATLQTAGGISTLTTMIVGARRPPRTVQRLGGQAALLCAVALHAVTPSTATVDEWTVETSIPPVARVA